MAQNNSKQMYHTNMGFEYSSIGSSPYLMRFVTTTNNLLGDPEFEMWLTKPQTMENLSVDFNSTHISLFGASLIQADVAISNGDAVIGKLYNSTDHGLFFPYPEDTQNTGYFTASIWKTGYLPIINLYCRDKSVQNETRSFTVRNAFIGTDPEKGKEFTLGTNAALTVEAYDQISTGKGFIIGKGGKAVLTCDGVIDLTGTVVESGGELNATGSKVIMGPGFNAKEGSRVTINTSRK